MNLSYAGDRPAVDLDADTDVRDHSVIFASSTVRRRVRVRNCPTKSALHPALAM